jgi:hypothetical protein
MNTAALYIAVMCALFLAACGPAEKPQPKGPSMLSSLPVTLEGVFSLSVEKGEVDEQGISEANFGTLAVNGVEHLVQVSGAVLRAAAIPRTGGKVKATLGSRTHQYGAPTYIITAMEKQP